MPFTQNATLEPSLSMVDDFGGMESNMFAGLAEVETVRNVEMEAVPESELDKQVHITLTESETFWVFDQPSTFVTLGTDEAVAVKEENARCVMYPKIPSATVRTSAWALLSSSRAISCHPPPHAC